MRPNIGRAILGGFVGTLAITMMTYWVGPTMGLMKMDIAASMLVHFMNGTIIFPLIYAFLLYSNLEPSAERSSSVPLRSKTRTGFKLSSPSYAASFLGFVDVGRPR